MPVDTGDNRLSILPSAGVFHTPDRVALEQGLFAREGLEVTVVRDWAMPQRAAAAPEPAGVDLKLSKDSMIGSFEEFRADTFNMCEWGVIQRAELHTERPVRIGYLRPAVVTQAIISFDDEIQEPHDLVDRPVGVGGFSGQHYTTLQLLEGPLRREQLNVIDVQGLDDLLELAQRGDLAAVTVMEPFVSLALKRGGHIVSSTFYRGGQVFAEMVPQQARLAYLRAVNSAVDIVNADLARYRSYITEDAHGALLPDELRPDFYRYTYAAELSHKRFEESYGWLSSWGFTSGQSAYESIVSPLVELV
jgi:NitT/TauT family transport system substrate-binding protein